MKKCRLFVIVTLVISLLVISSMTAYAGAPSGNWASGIACQNMDTAFEAQIQIMFYQEGNATPVLTYPDTIPAGGSKGWFTPSIAGLPASLNGSAVVSSSTELVCNVNTTNNGAGTAGSPYRIGTSSGFSTDQTATVLYAPQVEKAFSGWDSYIAIQNPGNADVLVDITYKDRYGVAYPAANESYTIHPQTNKIVYQSDNAGIPTNFLGSAKIAAHDGTSPLAAVVNFYNSGADSSTSQFLSYDTMSAGAEKLFVPYIVRNYYGYNGGLSIQNIGTIDTTVQIVFTFGTNTYTYNSPNIPQGYALALYTPNIAALNPVDSLNETLRAGSATIQALPGASVVAIVNQSNFGGAGIPAERVGQGAAYNAIPDGTQSLNAFLPQIPNKAGGIFSGGFQITNTTNLAGTCTITYAGVPAATETNVPLPAGGSISRYGPNVANLTVGFNGAVSAVCTQNVVTIANLAVDPGTGKLGDSFTQSNGINQ